MAETAHLAQDSLTAALHHGDAPLMVSHAGVRGAALASAAAMQGASPAVVANSSTAAAAAAAAKLAASAL